jgi:hypothetical protein
MMSFTLLPLFQQIVAPVFQLRGDGFNADGSLNRPRANACGLLVGLR